VKLVTAEQMREMDRRTIEEFGVPGATLMENAGTGVFRLIAELLGEAQGKRALVFCGKGNNGGDGFVVARLLHEWGADTAAVLAGKAADLKGDARANFDAATKAQVPIHEITGSLVKWPQAEALAVAARESDVLVDALLGTGLSGEVTGLTRDLIEFINTTRAHAQTQVVAVDVPSGVDADTGRTWGVAAKADHTVTMGLAKVGLVLYPGAEYAGALHVADIGTPEEIIEQAEIAAELIERAQVRALLPPRRRDAHKGDFGRVLLIAGSRGMAGAAALCARAALRAGAGLVYLGAPESLNDILQTKVDEVITRPLPQTDAGTLSADALPLIEAHLRDCDALALGPGLSRNPATAELVRRLVRACTKPMVLDADGLNAVSEEPECLVRSAAPAVITPHPGEMARLMGSDIPAVQVDRLEAARTAAKRLGCVALLKGARTVIATPEGQVRICPTGNPGMASGGTGDVLTGMIAGFLGQGMSPFDAATAGAFLHGLAGDLAAASLTEVALVAGDVLDAIPLALHQALAGGETGPVE
jgi:NAD(P)H-hydrate epimerase